jgi:tetratricopeptide (TPR) repeat protein
MDPGNLAAWRGSGAVLLESGEARQALDAFRRLLQLRPEDAGGIHGAARALARLGRLDEAARVAAFAARLDPSSGNELLVQVNLRRKDHAAARMAADAARQADPTSPLPLLIEGVQLFEEGKFEEALPRLEEAVQLTASRRVQVADVRFYAGQTLARLRRYTDAEARLADELKWFPDSVRAREALASVYHDTGRTSDIPTLIQDVIRWSPTPEGYVAAFHMSSLAGEKPAAAAILRAEARQKFGEGPLRTAEQHRW